MRFDRRLAAIAAGLCLAVAAPAQATTWLVAGTGTLAQTPTPAGETRLEGVPFAGQSFAFLFTVDDSLGSVALPPPLSIGTWQAYPGAITSFTMAIGPWALLPTADALRQLNVVDNVPNPANTQRIDQLTWSEGLRFPGGVRTSAFATSAPLAPDQFIGNFLFGRVVSAPTATPPGLVDGTAVPDLAASWFTGAPGLVLQFDVRQGAATSAAEANALPRARFSAVGLQVEAVLLPDVPAVPEPASWALLIAGFGLVGAAARRRAAHPA